MNENITNCLFALPSYFSGLVLLVGHREENTNYKKKLIKIASKFGPTMNISYRPRWMAVFCYLITTGLAKNQYSIRCTKPAKYQFS
jgi:hypothetical protein